MYLDIKILDVEPPRKAPGTEQTKYYVTRDACFLIEDGRLTAPLGGMRFTESVLTVLAGVQAVGSQVRSQPIMNVWNGAVSAPAVRTAAFRLGAAPIATP